ncbi:MAG: transcription termination/antitermination protein NusG [Corynebacterium sp.]|nr:transcription termination/antitermination protein NusG [Corynebacterium sp.]
MEHIMTENNEDTGNNIGDAVIESVQEQAAEAAEATESNDATEAMDTVEAPPAEVGAVDADPAEAESAEAPSAEEEAEVDADADYRRRLRKYTKELKELPGQWYIIQCYSGYENKVKTNLDMRAQTLEVEDSIFDVVVPVEQVIENKDGKKKLVKRKLLPGYVLVRMELNDAAWSVVRDTPGVTSFVGNEGNATPVRHRDVAKFLLPKEGAASAGEAAANAAEGEQVISMPEQEAAKKYAHDYVVGEAVTILSGPFASVSATISEIDEETGKMVGLVSIFGRETPVELSPTEIERIN